MAKRKTSAGRQRIEMKKIESEEARHVCFSKRRMGLFKKASDLSTLTGAQIAIIVFSQAGKAFSFGSPAVDVVIDRFLSGGRPPSGPTPQSGYAKLVRELNARCMEVTSCMEAAKRRKLALEGRLKALAAESHLCAWASNVDSLELSELEQLSVAMEALKARSDAWLGELLRAEAPCSSNLVLAVNPRGMFDPYNAEAMMAHSAGHMGYGTGFF